MDIVEIDFERILKTHYFLFTSSSSFCAVLAFVVSYDCHPYFILSLACSLEIANFETRISSCGLQISSGNFIVVWVKLNPEWQCSAWNWEKTLLPVSVVWQYGSRSFQMGYTIPKGNYWILRIGLKGSLSSLQNSEFFNWLFWFFL